jgi:phosphomevalonate kinase
MSVASAPGKLVLVGEYAVLEGAPALVLAANRRVRASVAPRDASESRVTASGGANAQSLYRFDADGRVLREGPPLPLVDAILEVLARELGLAHAPAFEAALDTHAFIDLTQGGNGHKLGLGSSAALTVAFASALAEYTGRFNSFNGQGNRWLGRLISVHRHFQGGRGSGLDVAASLLGGVISYRLNGADADPAVVPRTLPDTFRLLAVSSGRASSTDGALARLAHWRTAQPRDYARHLGELAELANAADGAAARGDASALLDAVGAYGNALDGFGRASGIDIYSAEHTRIADLARRHAAAYKPSGAGGGDVGLAISNDAAALAALRVALEDAGFHTLDARVDPVGLQVQPTLE